MIDDRKEEMNMADDRIQLNEEGLDGVVGGKFSFYTEDGKDKCTVTDHGTFDTTSDGFMKYIMLRNANPGLREADYFQMCVDQHIIW